MQRAVAALFLAACTVACAAAAAAPGPRRTLLAAAPAVSDAAVGACCQRLAAVGFSSNLPVVVLDTAGRGLQKKGEDVPVRVCTCNSGRPFADYDGLATAAARGTSSANFTKKSYALALRRPDNGSADFGFLGMPADSDWVLYGGDEVDLTQGMRDYMAYNLARGSGRYASRTVYAEVFLVNDSRPLATNHYAGIYIGEEKVKRAKARVDAQPLKAPNLSGGFLVVFDNDNIEAGDFTFGPTKRLDFPFQLKYPKGKDATPEAVAWLLSYLNSFEDALFDPAWLAPQAGARSYASYIDGPSFVDFFLLVELTKNPDGYRGSTYMHKDRDGPLAMGPAWDYNEAFGLCCGYPIDGWQNGGRSGPGQAGGSAISPEGWRFLICADAGRCKVEPVDGTSLWYRRMWQDPRFKQAAAARWRQLRAGNWSDAAVAGLLDGAAAEIQEAALRNYQRYEWVLKRDFYPTGEAEWTSEVAALRGWLLQRLAWMDGALEAAAGGGAGAAGGVPEVKSAGGGGR